MDVDAGRPARADRAGHLRGRDTAPSDRALLVADGAAGAGRADLALAITVAGRTTGRLVTFLALFWMTGGLITLRFALAIRPRPGFRLGLAAATAAVVGAVLVLFRERLSGLVDPDVFVGLLGISAVLTGTLRILGGFAAEERLGHRWTLGGIVLGILEVALGALLLLTSEVHPDLLVPIVAAWGAVSGILLLAQGLGLRRLARTWRQASGTMP